MIKDLYKSKLKSAIDYEGKLNKHEDYIRMLNILEEKCSFIGITSIGGTHEIAKKVY